jgi:hypothetical protein
MIRCPRSSTRRIRAWRESTGSSQVAARTENYLHFAAAQKSRRKRNARLVDTAIWTRIPHARSKRRRQHLASLPLLQDSQSINAQRSRQVSQDSTKHLLNALARNWVRRAHLFQEKHLNMTHGLFQRQRDRRASKRSNDDKVDNPKRGHRPSKAPESRNRIGRRHGPCRDAMVANNNEMEGSGDFVTQGCGESVAVWRLLCLG